jgi:hypothetical protein
MIDPVSFNENLHVLDIGKFGGGPDNLDKLGDKTLRPEGIVLKFFAKADAGGVSLYNGA